MCSIVNREYHDLFVNARYVRIHSPRMICEIRNGLHVCFQHCLQMLDHSVAADISIISAL